MLIFFQSNSQECATFVHSSRACTLKKKELRYHFWSKAANLAVKSIEMYLKIMNEERRSKEKNGIDRPRSLLKWTTTYYHYYLWWTHTKKWTRKILPSLLNIFSLLDVLLTYCFFPFRCAEKTHEAYYSSWLKKIVVGNKPPLFQLEFRNELKHTSKRNLNKTQQSNITLYQLQSNYVTKYSIKMKTKESKTKFTMNTREQ